MEKNAGTIDRVLRVVIGIVLFYAVLTNMIQGIPMYVAGILGLIMLATVALSCCPLYPILKKTLHQSQNKQDFLIFIYSSIK